MTKRYYVYLLLDNGTPFYVGKGQGKRVGMHRQEAKRGHHCHKCNKIRKIWREGREYTEQIIFETDDEREALDKEIALIAEIGHKNLCNLTLGGEGATKPEYVKQRQRVEGVIIGSRMRSAMKYRNVDPVADFNFKIRLQALDAEIKEIRRQAREEKKRAGMGDSASDTLNR